MATNVVHFRGTRKQLADIVRSLPLVLNGHMQDPGGLAQGLQLRIGAAALSLIKVAFIAKSRGGTDEAGDSWTKLSPKYVAYGRRHPELTQIRKQAKAEGRPGRPMLTKKQDERWRRIFAGKLHQVSAKQRKMTIFGGTSTQAKSAAAAYAWAVLKAEGGQTIFDNFKDAPVEILRDTGVLLNSLSPGVNGPSGHENQVFRVQPGTVIVGTNRKGAAAHHKGSGKLPERRLWPRVERWPSSWWQQITGTLRDGAAQVLIRMLGG